MTATRMLRVRVEGAAQEAAAFADALARAGVVIGRSRGYEGRGARRDVRIYLEVDATRRP